MRSPTRVAYVALCLIALALWPIQPARADFQQGLILLQQKYYDEAAAEFEKVVDKDKKNDKGWYYLGLSYLKAKKYAEAIAAFAKARELAPNEYEYASLQGKAMFGAEKWYDAAMTFDAAYSLAQDDKGRYESLWFKGNALMRAGNHAAAASTLERAEAMKPDLALSVQVGDLWFTAGEYAKATERYKNALTARPGEPTLLRKYAIALAQDVSHRKDQDQAAMSAAWGEVATAAAAALAAVPNDVDLKRLVATAQALSGGGDAAVASYQAAIAAAPTDCSLKADLGGIYLDLGRNDEGTAALKEAMDCIQAAKTAGGPGAEGMDGLAAGVHLRLATLHLTHAADLQERGDAESSIALLEESIAANRRALEELNASRTLAANPDVDALVAAVGSAIDEAQKAIEALRFNQSADEENKRREAEHEKQRRALEAQQQKALEAQQAAEQK